MPVGTEQPPQPAEETVAAGFVERVEPSYVDGNVAKVVTLGVLQGRLRIKGCDHPLLRERVAFALVRFADEQLQVGQAVGAVLEPRNVVLGNTSQA